jgi:hypothetical protein
MIIRISPGVKRKVYKEKVTFRAYKKAGYMEPEFFVARDSWLDPLFEHH